MVTIPFAETLFLLHVYCLAFLIFPFLCVEDLPAIKGGEPTR